MPTKDEHIVKAAGNQTFADSIDATNQTRIDWKLIVLFYAAVHYVEAYLAKALNQHLRSHTTRDSYISKEANLRKIRVPYAHLKYFGYNARYEVSGFTAQHIQDAIGYLAQVKASLIPLLK